MYEKAKQSEKCRIKKCSSALICISPPFLFSPLSLSFNHNSSCPGDSKFSLSFFLHAVFSMNYIEKEYIKHTHHPPFCPHNAALSKRNFNANMHLWLDTGHLPLVRSFSIDINKRRERKRRDICIWSYMKSDTSFIRRFSRREAWGEEVEDSSRWGFSSRSLSFAFFGIYVRVFEKCSFFLGFLGNFSIFFKISKFIFQILLKIPNYFKSSKSTHAGRKAQNFLSFTFSLLQKKIDFPYNLD